jgi:ketosteroid isomerase-like protein
MDDVRAPHRPLGGSCSARRGAAEHPRHPPQLRPRRDTFHPVALSESNAETLRGANEAFNRGDVEGFLEFCTDDVEIEDLNNAPDLPSVARGIDEVRETLVAWVNAFEDFRGEIAEYIEVGDNVACITDYRGTNRSSGLTVHHRLVDVWKVRDGKLVRGTLGYRDRESALTKAGQDAT